MPDVASKLTSSGCDALLPGGGLFFCALSSFLALDVVSLLESVGLDFLSLAVLARAVFVFVDFLADFLGGSESDLSFC